MFIPRHEFFTINFGTPLVAVIFAYIPALIVKNIYMWWAIRTSEYFKFPWKDWLWQGLVGPILAAIATYGVIELICQLIWARDIITSVLILLIATLPGLYIFAFFAGLLGTFDDNTLTEFGKAARLAGALKFLTVPLYKLTAIGARVSPLHGKFPITIYSEAAREAEQLTAEKEKLIL